MKYELAKELKDAGFPGSESWGFKETPDGSQRAYFSPTLSELIEACGGGLYMLRRNIDGTWLCTGADQAVTPAISLEGRTPEDAVARLWLALNKK